jgi:hypothetical protein
VREPIKINFGKAYNYDPKIQDDEIINNQKVEICSTHRDNRKCKPTLLSRVCSEGGLLS